jgi:uncharacterized protein
LDHRGRCSFHAAYRLKLTHYTGNDKIEGHERFALEYGPVLLALIGSSSVVLIAPGGQSHDDILHLIKQDPYRPLTFNIDGHPEYNYIPYSQVLAQPFTCFPVIDIT